jgi:outer membrane receptor for ferrienterochelin and colicins
LSILEIWLAALLGLLGLAQGEAPPAPAGAEPPAPIEEPAPPPPESPPGAPRPAAIDLQALLNIDLQVWSATKTATSAQEVAAVVTVVTSDDIRRWGYRSVAEVLQQTLGFYVVDDFMVPNAGVRGISAGLWGESSAIKVMIDGHAVPFRPTSGNWLGPELVPMSAVDYVEIVTGPASVLYGADALLGVVNVVTRRNLQGASIHASTSYDRARLGYDEDLSVGTHLGAFDFLGAFRLDRRVLGGLSLPISSPAAVVPSYRPLRDDGTLRDRGLADLEQSSTVGMARIGYARGSLSASLTGWISQIERPGELSPWLQLADGLDPAGREIHNRIGLRQEHLALHLAGAPVERLKLTFEGMAFAGGPTAADHAEVRSDVFYVQRRFGFLGTDLNLEAQWQPTASVTGIIGSGFIFDREELLSTVHIAKANLDRVSAGGVITALPRPRRDFVNPAAYAQVILTPFEQWLSLIGGLRYDHHNIYGGQLSTRLGVVVQPLKDVHFKALYGSAFKAPSPLLLYGVPLQPGDIIGNQDLQVQQVRTAEVELSYRPFRQLAVRTDVAWSRLHNKAEFTPLGPNTVARNLAELEVISWETSADARIDWLLSYASFEIQRSVRSLGQDGYLSRLVERGATNYPAYNARLGAELAPVAHLRLAGQLAYVGPRPASDSNVLATGHTYALGAYAMVNAGLSLVDLGLFPSGPLELALYCRNVADVHAADPGFTSVDYPIARRSFVLEARLRF